MANNNGEFQVESGPPEVDRYGFLKKSKDLNVCDDEVEAAARSKQLISVQQRHERKWAKMSNAWDTWVQKKGKREKIKERCRKGIPESMRGKAWVHLCGAGTHPDRASKDLFSTLATKQYPEGHAIQPFLEIIEKDLHRTFPHHINFTENDGAGQESMRRVLRAYAG